MSLVRMFGLVLRGGYLSSYAVAAHLVQHAMHRKGNADLEADRNLHKSKAEEWKSLYDAAALVVLCSIKQADGFGVFAESTSVLVSPAGLQVQARRFRKMECRILTDLLPSVSPVLMLTVVKMMSLAWIDCNSWLHVTPDFIDEGQGSGAQWKDRRAGGNVAYRYLEFKGQEVHSLGFWGLRLDCVSTLPQLSFLACAASWGR